MFIAQKNGVIRVFRNGTLLPTPFIDLSGDVNSYLDRGLVGMTTHPNFPQTPYVYALYTYDPPGVTDDGVGPRVARLERIAADPTQLDVAATGPGARTVLLGRNSDASVITNPNTNATLTCWQNGAMVADCIPQDSRRHAIGYGAVRTRTVRCTSGTGTATGSRTAHSRPTRRSARSCGSTQRPATGSPQTRSTTATRRATPRRRGCTVSGTHSGSASTRVSGEMLIADVGQSAWESIHRGQAGMNYGWPCYEGGSHVYGVYQNTALCQAIYSQGPRGPGLHVLARRHRCLRDRRRLVPRHGVPRRVPRRRTSSPTPPTTG